SLSALVTRSTAPLNEILARPKCRIRISPAASAAWSARAKRESTSTSVEWSLGTGRFASDGRSAQRRIGLDEGLRPFVTKALGLHASEQLLDQGRSRQGQVPFPGRGQSQAQIFLLEFNHEA